MPALPIANPAGKALFTMVSAFAEFERDLIRERVKAGLDRPREEGTKLGRPAVDDDTTAELNKARYKLKWSVRKIAQETGLSVGAVSKYTAEGAAPKS